MQSGRERKRPQSSGDDDDRAKFAERGKRSTLGNDWRLSPLAANSCDGHHAFAFSAAPIISVNAAGDGRERATLPCLAVKDLPEPIYVVEMRDLVIF
jgi:hypothetical protein